MALVLLAVGLLFASGLAAQLARRSPMAATLLGAGGALAGGLTGIVPALRVLLTGQPLALSIAWHVPYGSFALELDALSAFFMLPIMALPALAASYGAEYLWHARAHKSLGTPWMYFNWLMASMALVVLARNAVLFIIAWELMSLASFFLVCFEDERASVREAGWTYLIATHLGTAFLFVMFLLLGQKAGGLDFGQFLAARERLGPQAGLFFLFALIGFGTKAGLMPLHVWLPEAHPAAPSHVSAVMSGVMIKTGIYGIARMLTLLGPPPAWWGWTLIAVGAISGVAGVLFALAQHDLKRLLAYHSVENIGIITMGLGLGVLGRAVGSPTLAVLGLTGALLHTLNHAIFKGLPFLGAGSVLHGSGTLDIDRLGGLMKRMPATGLLFLVGAAAICGLPPLNGFVSEFLIYLGSFNGAVHLNAGAAAPALIVVGALALIGGLAAACFTKAVGIVFLGEPRTPQAAQARESGWAMRLPMVALAALCLMIGLLAPLALRLVAPAAAVVGGLDAVEAARALAPAAGPLVRVAGGGLGLCALIGLLAWARRKMLAGRSVGATGTWDCGYAAPTARMQYTASSYAQPITTFFQSILRTRQHVAPPKGLFPDQATLHTETPDVCVECFFAPLFRGTTRLLGRLHALQAGSIHLYILYIAVTLIVLLIWKLR